MPGLTLVDCRLTYCLRWELCRGSYSVKGEEFLGKDEQENKHYLCKNFCGGKFNKLGSVKHQTVPEIEKVEQRTLI